MSFHEQKLWQESYVALMDIHQALEAGVADDLVESAQTVAATIADSLTRQDRRIARDILQTAVGQVAKTRTHLAVAWGRGILDDETFKAIDDKYATLSDSLQTFR